MASLKRKLNNRPPGNSNGPVFKQSKIASATAENIIQLKEPVFKPKIESGEIQIATIESYINLPVDSLYNFIRFKAFPDIKDDDDQKKVLFLASADIPLLETSVFKQIISAVNENNFDKMKEIVASNIATKGNRGVIQVSPGTWPIIVDAYFKESDMLLAGDLLRTLVHLKIEKDSDSLARFIENYMSSGAEKRSMMVLSVTGRDHSK